MNFLFVAQANFCPFAPTTLFVFSCEESGNGPAMLAKGFFFFLQISSSSPPELHIDCLFFVSRNKQSLSPHGRRKNE